jgi:hypothetical protein
VLVDQVGGRFALASGRAELDAVLTCNLRDEDEGGREDGDPREDHTPPATVGEFS